MPKEEVCSLCGRPLGGPEKAYVWEGEIVCGPCFNEMVDIDEVLPLSERVLKPPPAQPPVQVTKSASGLGIAALVLRILTCPICWLFDISPQTLRRAGLILLLGAIGIWISIIGDWPALGFLIGGAVVCAVAIVMAGDTTRGRLDSIQRAGQRAERPAPVLPKEGEDREQPEVPFKIIGQRVMPSINRDRWGKADVFTIVELNGGRELRIALPAETYTHQALRAKVSWRLQAERDAIIR